MSSVESSSVGLRSPGALTRKPRSENSTEMFDRRETPFSKKKINDAN